MGMFPAMFHFKTNRRRSVSSLTFKLSIEHIPLLLDVAIYYEWPTAVFSERSLSLASVGGSRERALLGNAPLEWEASRSRSERGTMPASKRGGLSRLRERWTCTHMSKLLQHANETVKVGNRTTHRFLYRSA